MGRATFSGLPGHEAYQDLLRRWPDIIFTADINPLKLSSSEGHHQQINSMYTNGWRSPSWQSPPSLCLVRDYALICLGLESYPTVPVLKAMNFFSKTVLCAAVHFSGLQWKQRAKHSELSHYSWSYILYQKSHSMNCSKAWLLIYTPSYYFLVWIIRLTKLKPINEPMVNHVIYTYPKSGVSGLICILTFPSMLWL